jgi:UDP-N-acetylmuramoyl-L-alanyl-D-glutamate--2,6-diaminopimelate ligase
MKLNEILRDIDAAEIDGAADVEVTAVTADSRRITPGAAFVAIPGTIRDGAEFVSSAIERGASVIIAERAVAHGAATLVVVPDARAALALATANLFGRPAGKIGLIGVTGTSGKTTTTKMVESILDATGDPVGLIGTIEYRAGAIRELSDRTTPDAALLQKWFAEMLDQGVKFGVMEVSSHALVQKRTHGITFDAAVFTNLSRDHLDYHADMDDYFRAKRILFDQLKEGKRSVVNIDDDYGRRLAGELKGRVTTFGRGADADIHPADGFEVSVFGLRGTFVTPWGEVSIESPLIGYPNLYNWMGAVGAALTVGIERDAIERGVRALTSVRGRFERVDSPDGAAYLVDYAHKPDALEKLLQTTRQLAPERKIVLVFGCGGDRDQGKRSVMGEIAGKLADYTILTSDNPRSEKPENILQQIEEGVRKSNGKYEVISDRRAAIERAVGSADASTIVLVAGKGHENYQVVADQILHFDDREELELAIEKKRGGN